MNTIWSLSMITTLQHTLNGTILGSTIWGSWQPTNSTLSIWLSLKALTIKAWSPWYTPRERLTLMTDKESGGIVTDRIYATSKIHWRKRQVDFTIRLLSKFNSCMMTMKCTWRIAIHIHTQMPVNFYSDSVRQNRKTEYEKP